MPECIECSDVDSVLHDFFYCAKTNNFIKHVEHIFKKLFRDNFQLNVHLIVFGPTPKIGNTASKLGIFLCSKVIKTIWICRKVLEESKPCNEMDIFLWSKVIKTIWICWKLLEESKPCNEM